MTEKSSQNHYLDEKYHNRNEKSVYVDKVFTVPNMLTLSRLIALPFLLWSLYRIHDIGPVPAVATGCYMFLSDTLDGVLAKALGQISLVGAVMDPVIDKLIINTVALFLAFQGWVPFWAISVILLRDLALIIFGLRIFLNYGTLVTPVLIGRITPLLWGAVFITAIGEMSTLKWIFIPLAFVFTLFSGYIYYSRYNELIKKKERGE